MSRATTTGDRLREEARRAVDAGNVEDCWWLHGKADATDGLPLDPEQANDPYYGDEYRRGYCVGSWRVVDVSVGAA